MRVVMLSWEYPPMRVGGIAAALEGLAPALAKQGIEVHVITCGAAGGPAEEEPQKNLFIHRVNVMQQANDFIHWVHLLNGEMEQRGNELLTELVAKNNRTPKNRRKPILLHVHDWLGLFAGRALKYRHKLPMLATIHATEYGRNNGIHTDMQRYINRCEWELQYEAWRVIVCTHFMLGELQHSLSTPTDKVDIIYNGINPGEFNTPLDDATRAAFRANYATPNEKIIFFIGRMVREKGAQMLIEALPLVRAQYNDAKLVIAGGGHREHLEAQARNLGISPHVYFTGRVSDADRDRLYRIADVAVYPSLYEPFGIVALEAMAAKVPVVVSNAGGLPEVVQHDITGTVTYVGNADSLAWGIVRTLKDPGFARHMADAAFERLHHVFDWNVIAAQTKTVYDRVHAEYVDSAFAQGK